MRNLTPFFQLSIVTVSVSLFAFAADPLPELSKFQTNETIVVQYQSQGCFGGASYEFTFHRDKSVSVLIVSTGQKRKHLGQLLLTSSEITELDTLLNLYRQGQMGVSTTSESISITLLRSGKVVHVEHLTDNSGFASQLKGRVTFTGLVRRLDNKS